MKLLHKGRVLSNPWKEFELKHRARRCTLNFGIRNPVYNVDIIAGFAIRRALFSLQNVDMLKLPFELVMGLK